jgi:regulator of sirC expression with transglutaminase-like and TPR domain
MRSPSFRERFAELAREPEAELADAALLCCAEVEADFDVEAWWDRLGELAAGLSRREFTPADPASAAHALSGFLAGELGFTGDAADYDNPRNSFLTEVLRRRRGLPITLSILYVAVGRLAGIEAYGLNTAGHFLVGVGFAEEAGPSGTEPAAVIDPFHDGRVFDGGHVVAQLRQRSEAGHLALEPGMLQPAHHVPVTRRLLNNLSRSYVERGETAALLWTIELKRLLPDTGSADVSAHARALEQLGRFRDAAAVCEEFLARNRDALDGTAAAALEQLARHARARLN